MASASVKGLLFERGTPRANEVAIVTQIEDQVRGALAPIFMQSAMARPWLDNALSALRSWRAYAAVGTFAALAATVTLVYLPGTRAPEIGRIDPAQTYRSLEIVNLTPKGIVQTVPRKLSWHPVAGASSYEVGIRTVDESDVWTASSIEPSLRIPANVGSRLDANRTYLWQVTALDTSGRMLARSNLQRFFILSKR
jgi:hypothetical protein